MFCFSSSSFVGPKGKFDFSSMHLFQIFQKYTIQRKLRTGFYFYMNSTFKKKKTVRQNNSMTFVIPSSIQRTQYNSLRVFYIRKFFRRKYLEPCWFTIYMKSSFQYGLTVQWKTKIRFIKLFFSVFNFQRVPPINPDNACILRITAAAGTKLADAYSFSIVKIVLKKRCLQSKDLHPSRRLAPSDFRPLRKILDCSHPQVSGQCLSPSEPGHALTPGTHCCLGRPLPRQQANRKRTHPLAESHHLIRRYYPVLPAVSHSYPGPGGR